jgi:outer membrane protein TolC
MLALKEAGQQNAAAVEQSNALLYSTQLSVFELESNIYQEENAISVLLGRTAGAIDHATIESQTVPAKFNYGVPMQLLAKRPDVLQAELSFRSAYELTKAAQASLYPTITITTSSSSVGLGLSSSTLSDFFKPENIVASLIGGISQPLFNRRSLKGNLKIAQAQQEEALLNFKNTVIAAGQEVSDILFEYQSSIRKNDYRDKQIASLNMAVSYTQELLTAGEANYTEVLTAQQNLLAAQLSQISDKLDQLTYSVSLYKALGGGAN